MLDKRKRIFIWASFTILIAFIVHYAFFITCDLVTLEDTSAIVSSASYLNMTAVVTTEGNCYIRGYPVSDKLPYGVGNVDQYNHQYNSLDLEKANRFVQIYSGNDAISVRLSQNGGTIITSENKLYLFSDDEAFKTPGYFCENVLDAKLLGNRVYILTAEGILGYYRVSSPQSFIPLLNDITKFIIADLDESIWVLTNSNELWAYKTADNLNNGVCCAVGVHDFDVLCAENLPGRSTPRYTLGYIRNGSAFGYNDYGIPTEEVTSSLEAINTNVLSIKAYSEGVIVINRDNQALVYGGDLLGNASFNGAVIAENVLNISASLSCVNFVLENDDMICCGSLPSSRFVYFQDIINKNSDFCSVKI